MLPTKFRYIWPNRFRGEEFFKSANQKQESPVVAMFVYGSRRNERDKSESSIDLYLNCENRTIVFQDLLYIRFPKQ